MAAAMMKRTTAMFPQSWRDCTWSSPRNTLKVIVAKKAAAIKSLRIVRAFGRLRRRVSTMA